MFARIQTTRTSDLPDTGPAAGAPLREFCDVLRMHPAYAGAYFLTDVVAATRVLLTLWRNRQDAERSSERTRERVGGRPFRLLSDRIVEVVDDRAGRSTGDPAGAAIAEFDGPVPDARRAEIERATTGWAADAWAATPASLRMITMWDQEALATVVLHVDDSVESLECAGRAIRAARPSADADRRIWPDRVAVCRVDHADSGAAVAG